MISKIFFALSSALPFVISIIATSQQFIHIYFLIDFLHSRLLQFTLVFNCQFLHLRLRTNCLINSI